MGWQNENCSKVVKIAIIYIIIIILIIIIVSKCVIKVTIKTQNSWYEQIECTAIIPICSGFGMAAHSIYHFFPMYKKRFYESRFNLK